MPELPEVETTRRGIAPSLVGRRIVRVVVRERRLRWPLPRDFEQRVQGQRVTAVSRRAKYLLIVTGGTAHGIGLEAPTGDLGLRGRAATIARGGLDAVGFVRSPFSIDAKQRLFAEPPHMQASMLFLPHGPRVPAIGDRVDVRVRFTATRFDEVLVSD